MSLKQAAIKDAATAMSLLKESAEWLKETGSDQWSDVLKGEDKHGLAQAVEKGEVFFFYNRKKQLAGMVAAWKTPTEWDRLLWQEIGTHQESCYLHRVIIRPEYRRKGYGKELLAELKQKFRGQVTELRLDCLGSNQKLIDFYRRNGFINVGNAKDFNGTIFELFSFILI